MVQSQELKALPFPAKIDYEKKTVTVTAGLGMPDLQAIYRDGLGCTVDMGYTHEHIRDQIAGDPTPYPPNLDQQNLLWPEGELVSTEKLPSEINKDLLATAVDKAFAEPDPKIVRSTRAVVVVYKGRIIAERYAPGFSKDTALIGWSMTKSITNALVGILVNQGKISINDAAPAAEWAGKDDPRAAITLDQLLRMSSGLDFVEVYPMIYILPAVMKDRTLS